MNEPTPDPAAEIARTLALDATPARRDRRVWLAAGALALAALAALVAWSLAGDGDGLVYTTEPARRGDLRVTVTATGTLEPTNQVDVGSEISGTIRTVEVDYNDVVGSGQVLARLDTSRIDAQVQQARAALAAAEARVLQTEATRKENDAQLTRMRRVHEVSGGRVPSQFELDAIVAAVARSHTEVASARADVSRARAALDAAETDLRKSVIISPIDGIVLVRSVEPGQTVAASLQAPVLFTLAESLERMELHVDVDEADVGQVSPGQPATFTVDAWPDRSFDARITQVRYGAQTVDNVVTYETVLEVDNPDRLLRPGMTATAEIEVRNVSGALLVPNAALRFTPPEPVDESSPGIMGALLPGRRFGGPERRQRANGDAQAQKVWVLRNGSAEARTVRIGSSDGTWTEVTGDGGIEPGTELVVDAVAVGS
jgi:HlyD family secretion protein